MAPIQDPSTETASSGGMESGRLEAFSDGVIAVIITIMVLELKAPEADHASELFAHWHIFASYAVSFTFVAIYWVNHHHLLHLGRRVGAATLWLNINWLFWLSLYPFVTSYVSDTKGAALSVACYAGVAAATAFSYGLLARNLSRRNEHVEVLARIGRRRMLLNIAAIGTDLLAIPVAFVSVPAALVLVAVPALIYFMPAKAAET
jgi:uncharacterized membrane protein